MSDLVLYNLFTLPIFSIFRILAFPGYKLARYMIHNTFLLIVINLLPSLTLVNIASIFDLVPFIYAFRSCINIDA